MPDYNRSVQDVYTAATKYCIRQPSTLSVLCQYEYGSSSGTAVSDAFFPSWVPRWDLANCTRRISAFNLSNRVAINQSGQAFGVNLA
jgi:hypothetical protein